MRINNHKLVGIPYSQTVHGGAAISGGTPRFLVIHYTANGSMSGAVNWFRNPAAKASAHLVIGHDGAVTQMQPFNKVCWHAGKSRWKNVKGLNSHSVGIEIANWGLLRKSGSGGWLTWTGKAVPSERVELAAHKNEPGVTRGWETYDEAQFMATVAASQAIVAEYGIKPEDVVGHDDISPGRKSDPGPAFDMDKFRALVFGRDEDDWDDMHYKVRANSGLNMRTGAGTHFEVIKTLDDNTVVNVIERHDVWWLVAEVVNGHDATTGYVHSRWLQPA